VEEKVIYEVKTAATQNIHFTKYYCDYIGEDELGETCSIHESANPNGRGQLEEPKRDGRKISKSTLRASFYW
jgi:hypothetical protein